jgi:hypothetical protein
VKINTQSPHQQKILHGFGSGTLTHSLAFCLRHTLYAETKYRFPLLLYYCIPVVILSSVFEKYFLKKGVDKTATKRVHYIQGGMPEIFEQSKNLLSSLSLPFL